MAKQEPLLPLPPDMLGPFEVPSPSFKAHPTTGLVNGIACPMSSFGETNQHTNSVVFYLQTGEPDDRTNRKAMFVAIRQHSLPTTNFALGSKFHIFDVSTTVDKGDFFVGENLIKDDDRYVGKLCRCRNRAYTDPYIAYDLFQGRGETKLKVTSIFYEMRPFIKYLTTTTFRIAHVILYSEDEELGAVDKSLLDKTVKSIVKKEKTIVEAKKPEVGIHLVSTKLPSLKQTGEYLYDFGGRGKGIFREHLQLFNKDDEEIVNDKTKDIPSTIQMAGWQKGDYSIDFKAPFNAFQAFGFALAQFDL